MKIDLMIVSIIIGVIVVLVDIFYSEYLFGLNTPIIILALGLVIFSFVKRAQDEKKNK